MLEGELEVLWRLSSAQEACIHSVCNPVAVPSGINSEIFASVFYDCTEPGEVGLGIMRERMKFKGDIQKHLEIHEKILKNFYSLDEALNTNNRMGILETGELVYKNLEEYRKLVKNHTDILQRRAFLSYPTCMPGHYFIPPRGGRLFRELSFNPNKNYEGLFDEIVEGLVALDDFPENGESFGDFKLSRGDCGEGIMDSSLRGRLELTKELLKRVGF